ncbi:hypothetical protein EDD36DRAFT_185175 [Exophiala viscosa]|uniref:Uncharacterized protein n=1 Tax=Exophiala viscosa TaxID=2486360 RepID=A0AAN6E1E2_9EURO|nr:hypothetical protein EDD36DRAFT_185175 [Exophiala viscosa]
MLSKARCFALRTFQRKAIQFTCKHFRWTIPDAFKTLVLSMYVTALLPFSKRRPTGEAGHKRKACAWHGLLDSSATTEPCILSRPKFTKEQKVQITITKLHADWSIHVLLSALVQVHESSYQPWKASVSQGPRFSLLFICTATILISSLCAINPVRLNGTSQPV